MPIYGSSRAQSPAVSKQWLPSPSLLCSLLPSLYLFTLSISLMTHQQRSFSETRSVCQQRALVLSEVKWFTACLPFIAEEWRRFTLWLRSNTHYKCSSEAGLRCGCSWSASQRHSNSQCLDKTKVTATGGLRWHHRKAFSRHLADDMVWHVCL